MPGTGTLRFVRIALVCPYSLTVPGGVQGQVLGLARALRGLGHEAKVLGPCDGPPPEVGVITLGNSIPTAANGSMAPIAPDPSCALRTIAVLRDEHFDVLHLHEPLAPGPTVTSVAWASAPLVGTFHASGVSAAYRVLRPLTRWLARRLTFRCAVSEDARAMAARALGGEYLVLNNGIEVERFAKATPWPTRGPTVLFLSRHEARKGLDVLLAAMALLPPDARLWVASDGPETGRLQADAAGDDRVEWLGRIGDAERASRLRGADVLCAPSLRGESFGMVLLEGMAAQTPVVASDIAGYRNVAGGCGPTGKGSGGKPPGSEDSGRLRSALLVAPGDPAALARALHRVLYEPTVAAALVVAGEARADEFSMDHLAERYVDLYARAMAIHQR
ncbi:MAG: phosphatidyl-myo-inositol alpha-mannosyltransferase [Actinomycetota bacterium]|nr:phosphatidyl-myo-inositol alpha-mannosyltransferase [Actinomycetota bacterium]